VAPIAVVNANRLLMPLRTVNQKPARGVESPAKSVVTLPFPSNVGSRAPLAV
jgi:hypothetical protein